MEFLSAFSGLERIAIIAGAIIVGYWGFRLFASDRTPGLIFMGIACAVLVAVFATGGHHVQSVSSSLQTATNPAPPPEAEATAGSPQHVQAQPDPQPPAEADEQIADAAGDVTAAQDLAEVDGEAAAAIEAQPQANDILGARDLGGRIVSVKSADVTLEWTPPSD